MLFIADILFRLQSHGVDTSNLHIAQINGFFSVISRLRPLITAVVPAKRDPLLLPVIPAEIVAIISQHIALPQALVITMWNCLGDLALADGYVAQLDEQTEDAKLTPYARAEKHGAASLNASSALHSYHI